MFYSLEDYGFVDSDGIEMKESAQLIRFVYYILTTLSTIGYGDFLPKSVKEKIYVSCMMFGGLTIFSLIVNQMIDTLKDFKKLGKGAEETNRKDLAKFLGLLEYINKGVPIGKKL
jgi:hypothetical protein